MTTLICPRCRMRLTVSDLAPQRLTCPNCLAHLVNPHWGQTPDPSVNRQLNARPPRLLPLDHQVHRDARASAFALGGFAVISGGASVISFQIPHGWKIGTILALFAVASVVTIILQLRYRPDEPGGQIAAAMSETLKMIAGGIGKILLIVLGIIALLFGACAIMLTGANSLGGRWPPK